MVGLLTNFIWFVQVNHKFTWSSLFKGKDNFVIRVYPGIDYAFIVALIDQKWGRNSASKVSREKI